MIVVHVPGRILPVPRPDDRQVLSQWLDWQRATVRAKCQGVDEIMARRSLIATSPATTIAAIVAHLTVVEEGWMVGSFLGEHVPEPGGGWGDSDLRLNDLLDVYDAQCQRSREIAEAHDLDDLEQFAPSGAPIVSLRWILGHLIEETARHLGHLDLLREMIDGERGY
jgi:uncharacterized damage-inducible protein DinB